MDPRRAIGARITAKAIHVTNGAECSRRYGANRTKKMLPGVVLDIINNVTETGRKSCSVVGEFNLGGGCMKRATLNIRSIQIMAPTPTPTPVIPSVFPSTLSPRPSPGPSPRPTPPPPPPLSLPSPLRLPPPPGSPGSPAINPADTASPNTAVNLFPPVRELPVATKHGTDWFKDDAALKIPFNDRECKEKNWSIEDNLQNTHGPGSDVYRRLSRLDYFLLMFPPKQLTKMLQLTNRNLLEHQKRTTTTGELLKMFGVMILTTRYEFTSRASLWSTIAPHKYMTAPAFGKTGMARNRFDELLRYIVWSEQPKERPEGMSSEKFRWLLVDGFVDAINEYRAQHFNPSDMICVDESIFRWYGQGGHWINLGLPMYIAMDRKPLRDPECMLWKIWDYDAPQVGENCGGAANT